MTRVFTPHDHQKQALAHLYKHPRCALWMPMGGGKTVTTLTALETLDAVQPTFPALVLAPLRVARSTWPEEVEKWSSLKRLRVSVITGTPKQRERAADVEADIYCTNYEQIGWLCSHYGENWPFRTIIADEFTRLKSFRLRQGGSRAAALAKRAWRTERFIGLTGTPAPNGLKDLWGQIWFLDKGQRLGQSFSAFEMRWFTKGYDGYSLKPLEHAQAEIEERLRDICLTVTGLQVDEPIVQPVWVELAPPARTVYSAMEKEAFAVIETEGVEAVNAAVRLNKCIAAGTKVLTDSGWVRIEHITAAHRVWDGDEWVTTCGAVYNGVEPVVTCWGVDMTPDHKVMTRMGWATASEILNGQPGKGYDRPDIRLPDGFGQGRKPIAPGRFIAGFVECALRLRACGTPFRRKPAKSTPAARTVLWLQARRAFDKSPKNARDVETPRVVNVVEHALAMFEPTGQRLAQLWRARSYRLREMGGILFRFLGRYGPDVLRRPNFGAAGQLKRLFSGKLSLAVKTQTSQQHAAERDHSDTSWLYDSDAGFAPIRGQSRYNIRTDETRLAGKSAVRATPVLDLVNCGPRNRFTVWGREGAVVVHNCLQIANGAAYVDDNGAWERVHDGKLDALESVIEEANGASVLVAYNFKSDLERLRTRFPYGRTLDTDPQTIKDWNAGKIRLLFAHPASAGHGLNLADGGNILAFFGVNWNLEEHQQIIERIGPQRQKQAGYDRPVFIYPILARKTVDELVMKRLESKRSVQDILLEALKETKR